jgi:alpha,alpha-trehalose phosphorylase
VHLQHHGGKVGMEEKAYIYFTGRHFYRLTVYYRINNGRHPRRQMGGQLYAIVYGFGGFRLKEAAFPSPRSAGEWGGYRFKIRFGAAGLWLHVGKVECFSPWRAAAPRTFGLRERSIVWTNN